MHEKLFACIRVLHNNNDNKPISPREKEKAAHLHLAGRNKVTVHEHTELPLEEGIRASVHASTTQESSIGKSQGSENKQNK